MRAMDSARGEPCRDGTLPWSDVPKLEGPWNSWAAQAHATFNNRCKIFHLLTDGRPHEPPLHLAPHIANAVSNSKSRCMQTAESPKTGQATTLEVSTVVVLHPGIDEARQSAWPGRRGCTPRPSQPSQLRRRLTMRLVGSRTALRKTGIPSGINFQYQTERGRDADWTRLVPRWSPQPGTRKSLGIPGFRPAVCY